MILARMLAPKAEPDCPALYFRGEGEPCIGGGLRIRPEGTVTLDTYFNALYYGPYLRHTRAETVALSAVVSGRAELSLIAAGQDGKNIALMQARTEGARREIRFGPVCLRELPPDGMLYLSARAIGGEALLHEAAYETPAEPSPVAVAAVICTYRREACVLRSLAAIRRGIRTDEPELSPCLDVFVSDNGRSVALPEEPQTFLLPGKNCGGSGGFTRGLMAARDIGRYTHVLFMDDDIVFESETLARTIRFLQAAKAADKPLCVGGQMLLADRPTVQHEAGSSYIRGRLRPNGRGLDLGERGALLANARPKPTGFNAWWYFCFPLSAVDSVGLPLPLFIKTDDVEYALRMQPEVALVNGIGVWHLSFAEKYSPHLEYYIKRNELLVSALHGNGAGVLPAACKLLGCCCHAFQRRQAARIDFALRGYGDFLKGPDFFLQTEPESLNAELLAQRNKLEDGPTGAAKQLRQIAGMVCRLPFSYGKARRAFLARREELSSEAFWRACLSERGDGVRPSPPGYSAE